HDDRGSVELFGSGFPGTHSVAPRKKATRPVSVRAISFREEITTFRPQVLKLDVEGAEYDLLGSLRPGDLSSINCAFIEFHPTEDRDRRVGEIRAFLSSEGMTVVKERLRAFTVVRS